MNIVNGRPKHGLSLSIVVGLTLMLATPTWADFQAGFDAYKRGDYDTALKEWRPLAEQGDAVAQNNLGGMYHNGQGVPKDYQEAAKWYRQAAEQGDAEAQFNLGEMYHRGQGVPRDDVLAHMWVTLAAAHGIAVAVKWRDLFEKPMTLDQLAEAQRLAKEWRPKGK